MDRVRLPRRGVALLLAAGTLALGVPALAAAPALPEDMAMGAATAPVTVVEYASASCPHCARFNNAIFPVFKKKYVDTGQVRYVFREFLTPPTQVAAAAFMVARCAGQARYFTVLDVFFHGQEKMYQTGDVKSALNAAGAAGGLSPDQVKACVADVDALGRRQRARRQIFDRGLHRLHPDLRHQRQEAAGERPRGDPGRPRRRHRAAAQGLREALRCTSSACAFPGSSPSWTRSSSGSSRG
ncbi:MAG: thioredoxin domain-containing protein [Caulobacteraceae bacterium]